MRRIFALMAILALVVAFAMPVVTADAAHHEKNPCQAKEMMKKSGDETKQEMSNPCAAKAANPCAAQAVNPCAAKAANPCDAKAANPCDAKAANPCDAKAKQK